MKKGKIFIISGPSGSGKTSLYKILLSNQKLGQRLFRSISMTTRPKRPGEKNGQDYLFVNRMTFFERKAKGYFLEFQKVFDHYYGTPEANVRRMLKAGKNVLLCIDVKGARVISRKFPEAIKIFIKAGSLKELKKRLKARGTESPALIALRLKISQQELKEEKYYQYVVVNRQLKKAFRDLKRIINKEIQQV